MNRYILRRMLILIPVFLGITLINFIFVNLMPGDAVDAMMDPRLLREWTPEQIQARRDALGLNKPWPVRYVIWLKELAQGNMGYSYITQEPVLAKIAKRAGATLKLTVVSFFFAVALGVGLGLFSALKRYSFFDYLFSLITYVSISIPWFFFALMIIYVFAVKLRWFPTSGMRQYGTESSFLDEVRHMVLPVLCMTMGGWAIVMRYCRTSMLEVLHQEYLVTARAKGLTQRTLIMRHALRNALLPVITVVGLSIPGLISGSILVEAVFGWPGMGQLSVAAIGQRDYPVLMGVCVLLSLTVLLANLVTDLAYAFADPRIRLD